MRKAPIFYKGIETGVLQQHDDGNFNIHYPDSWLADPDNTPISLILLRSQQEYQTPYLFPFFYNMILEGTGTNRQTVCQAKHQEVDDYFGILITTARCGLSHHR